MSNQLTLTEFKKARIAKVEEEAGGEEFLEIEQELAAYIAWLVYREGQAAAEEIVEQAEILKDDPDKLQEFIDSKGDEYSDVIPEGSEEEEKVGDMLWETMRDGAALVGAFALLEESIERKVIQSGLTQSVRYYTNTFFERIIDPRLRSAITKYGLANSDELFTVVKGIVDSNILNSSPYWRVVANANVSRAHHYGMLRAGFENSKTGYQLVAVLDDRTSDICRSLNGKTFWVADAVAHMDKVIKTDPESIKEVSPWLRSAEEVKGKSNDELSKQGVLIPPFHGNCRTTLRLVD